MSLQSRLTDELASLRTLRRAGMIGGAGPRPALQALGALRNWGPLGGAVAMAAARHPDRTGVVDELGSLTFAEMDARANALARGWSARGLSAGDGVGILVRNHRGFFDATFAAAKLGARVILFNTDFAGPQIREVAEREGVRMLVHDDEYSGAIGELPMPLGTWRAWTDEPAPDTLEALIAESSPAAAPPKPASGASVVILTSGTTGTPKGAPRPTPKSLVPFGALLERVPYRSGDVIVVGAPMFHALGFAQGLLAIAMGSTAIVRRRFDAEKALEDLERHHATVLNVVPVMLRKMLELDGDAIARRDLTALRIIFVGGSQLGAELCERTLAAFGPVVYNLYGSTEVSYATIATPEDLRAEPGSVGRTLRGSVVKLLDERGTEVPTGTTGRIFVGNAMAFEGYTGGGGKEVLAGLMSTGDVGHFDPAGLLFIDGRDDDMIVSGGENVFPGEIEELLVRHEAIADAAVIGVDDEQWGQRLRAFVVARAGSELNEDDVKSYVRDNLARYKSPRDVVFLGELPRNPSGKVLKRELAAIGS